MPCGGTRVPNFGTLGGTAWRAPRSAPGRQAGVRRHSTRSACSSSSCTRQGTPRRGAIQLAASVNTPRQLHSLALERSNAFPRDRPRTHVAHARSPGAPAARRTLRPAPPRRHAPHGITTRTPENGCVLQDLTQTKQKKMLRNILNSGLIYDANLVACVPSKESASYARDAMMPRRRYHKIEVL